MTEDQVAAAEALLPPSCATDECRRLYDAVRKLLPEVRMLRRDNRLLHLSRGTVSLMGQD